MGLRPAHRSEVRGICDRVALVVRAEGTGAPLVVDSRGRLRVPAWLRRGTIGSLVVGTDLAIPMLVIFPVTVLDVTGDLLGGATR